jgi:hypothetical protein
MKTIYLTFDIDWACDEVVEDTILLLLEYDARATFLVTHRSDTLEIFRQHKDRFELGIHPNFNELLTRDQIEGNYLKSLHEIKQVVPEAVSARSHSMTQNSLIWTALLEIGVHYDLNTFIPVQSGISVNPFKTPDGLIRVPYCWEDDDHMNYGLPWDPTLVCTRDGLVVLDFHPIHVFLNTDTMERYRQAKSFLHDHIQLRNIVNTKGYGCRTFLRDLLVEPGIEYGLINEIKCCSVDQA